MTARFHLEAALSAGLPLALPAEVVRHCQVLRLQPGDGIVLFDGRGGEWQARVTRMGAREVDAVVERHDPVERELPRQVTLAFGMPANDRMDFLVEKATELGAAVLQPLVCARSVLRLAGERAEKKVAHWQKVAIAAAEQSRRTRVPRIGAVETVERWLARHPGAGVERRVLTVPGGEGSDLAAASARPAAGTGPVVFLSGPEGGLAPEEIASALTCGYRPLGLGPRVLRADTAPLAALVLVGG